MKQGQAAKTQKQSAGILCCMNCVGMHPDEPITMFEVVNRIKNPSRAVAAKLMSFEKKKKTLYANKSCMLCGRTYDNNGDLDETWELTARRVKQEFDHAGISGVTDSNIKQVVASCFKSWKTLWANRGTITAQDAEKMTFAGRLALIITHAQEARQKKNTIGGGQSPTKGLIV